jgi:hypothetical protein
MRSWKNPALLATIGLCSLGSLAAQDSLPLSSGLPIVSNPLQPQTSAPVVADPTPLDVAPVPGSLYPVPDTQGSLVIDSAPVMYDTWMSGPAPAAHCGCGTPAPHCMPAPCHSGCEGAAPVSSCGCQGGFGQSGGSGNDMMGSGPGVSSGILSPNANSGGLHTRYPYYNYRHPWHYQGPPSQNVTIVW